MTALVIRPAIQADLAAILALYNHHILNSMAIWREQAVPLSDRQSWYDARIAKGYPVLVATIADAFAGFASYADFRFGEGYRYTVENSVYVEDHLHGQGVGQTLMQELFTRARHQGLQSMIAGIGLPNPASVAFHERLGFTSCGLLPKIGYKNGQWLDLLLMQKTLSTGSAGMS